ncbi:fatty acid-binding protein 1, liver-like [Leucoraja erinacea]|uniref:fatty acid-binding protein 1, liver-like n=1 Tax=Leucoraja erinaceus TaxID=7782 RepID=UPI0024577811|nr:fatty acid-binding protein 1, liver-like [Leucoraja erinacea]
MSFSGKYEVESRENFEPFMKAIEMSNELIQRYKDMKGITEIVQNGHDFDVKITTGDNVIHNIFTIGQEAEFGTLAGTKIKSVANLDGANKIVIKLNSVTAVNEVNGDKLIDVLTFGDVTYKRISKRM